MAAFDVGITTYRGGKVSSEKVRNQLNITQLVQRAKIRTEVFNTLF